jgi:hypothetical protein
MCFQDVRAALGELWSSSSSGSEKRCDGEQAGVYTEAEAERKVQAQAQAEAEAVALQAALRMFHLWVNFAPLSRGTAACGYTMLQAAVLACSGAGAGDSANGTEGSLNVPLRVLRALPPGIQLDWEAIFEPDVDAFVARCIARGWTVVRHIQPDQPSAPLADIFRRVASCAATPRAMVTSILY